MKKNDMKKNDMRHMMLGMVTLSAASAFAVIPEVTNVTMSQAANRQVTVSYSIENAPAVITVDFVTNGVSIGGHHIQNLLGDVNRRIASDGVYSFTWRPDRTWNEGEATKLNVQAVVTAWAPDSTPEYMTVDILEGNSGDRIRYYPSESFLPGGGALSNDMFRTSHLLFKKVVAAGIPWTMGTVSEDGREPANEKAFTATLTNDYYLGVFELTQAQVLAFAGKNPSRFQKHEAWRMRPAENISYNRARDSEDGDEKAGVTWWPSAPTDKSILGKLRSRVGESSVYDFDLPTDAQWEYACRAGNGEGYWGDGSVCNTNADGMANMPGRWVKNQKNPTSSQSNTVGPEDATAICGSYAPNSWGFYDMHGNVTEWTIDGFMADASSLHGLIKAPTSATQSRVLRGGGWSNSTTAYCRSARRRSTTPSSVGDSYGLRIACRAGLK